MFLQGHHEFPPYNPDTLRSVYHIRNIDVFKLKQVNEKKVGELDCLFQICSFDF